MRGRPDSCHHLGIHRRQRWGRPGPARLLGAIALLLASDLGASVTEDHLVLPLALRRPHWEQGVFRHGALYGRGPATEDQRCTLRRVRLQNDWLTVDVFPEQAAAVGRVRHRPTDTDFFYWEEAVKNWLPYWESGVKTSFPYPEHGMATFQSAAYRIIEDDDGTVSVAAWMAFSRYIGSQHRAMNGRYSPLFLSQHIRLEADSALLSITYRISNPVGYAQGRRLWNDAIFPRWDHPETGAASGLTRNPGATEAQWLLPVAWASDHLGKKLQRLEGATLPLASLTEGSRSLFAWDRPLPFAGLYYPATDTNRLRIDDPSVAPGAKCWWPAEIPADRQMHSTFNIAELWGGFDHVFEGVEHWLAPGASASFTHCFGLVRGFGPCRYADEHFALCRPSTEELALIPWRSHDDCRVSRDGQAMAAGPGDPINALRFACPEQWQGELAIELEGGDPIVLRWPPTIPDDRSNHQRLKELLQSPINIERQGPAFNRGMYRARAAGMHPAGSTARGRVQLAMGQLDAAGEQLRQASEADPDDGEAWHLLGCIALEEGRPAAARTAFERARQARRPYPEAGWPAAVCALADDDRSTAIADLDRLLDQRPSHWEGRLLRCWLAISDDDSMAEDLLAQLQTEDPADPRLAWLAFLHRRQDQQRLILARLLEEPEAAFRLQLFQQRTRGRWIHPPRPVEEQ